MTYLNPHGTTCPWYNLAATHGAPNMKWCEETLCQWISEPANTWSNLGYIIVGIYITYMSYKHNYHHNLKQLGPIILFLGITSFFYHLSNFYTSQEVDHASNYLFLAWIIGMNFVRLGKVKPRALIRFNLFITILCTLISYVMYVQGWLHEIIIPVLSVVVFILEVITRDQSRKTLKWFMASCATFSLAFCFSYLDNSRKWCNPTEHGWFAQGHALWHWIGALAVFFIFKHYQQPALHRRD